MNPRSGAFINLYFYLRWKIMSGTPNHIYYICIKLDKLVKVCIILQYFAIPIN